MGAFDDIDAFLGEGKTQAIPRGQIPAGALKRESSLPAAVALTPAEEEDQRAQEQRLHAGNLEEIDRELRRSDVQKTSGAVQALIEERARITGGPAIERAAAMANTGDGQGGDRTQGAISRRPRRARAEPTASSLDEIDSFLTETPEAPAAEPAAKPKSMMDTVSAAISKGIDWITDKSPLRPEDTTEQDKNIAAVKARGGRTKRQEEALRELDRRMLAQGGSQAELAQRAQGYESTDKEAADTWGNLSAFQKTLAPEVRGVLGGLMQWVGEHPLGKELSLAPGFVGKLAQAGIETSIPEAARGRQAAAAELTAMGKDFVESADYDTKAAMKGRKPGLGAEAIGSAMQSITMMGLPMLAGIVTGGAGTVLSGMGLMTYGQAYGHGRKEKLSPDQAAVYAGIYTAIELLTEYAPVKALMSKNPGTARWFWNFLAREVPSEILATTFQDALDKVSVQPEMTWEDFQKDLLLTVLSTPMSAGLQAGAVRALQGKQEGLSEEQVEEIKAKFDAGLKQAKAVVEQATKVADERRASLSHTLDDGTPVAPRMEDGKPVPGVWVDESGELHEAPRADPMVKAEPNATWDVAGVTYDVAVTGKGREKDTARLADGQEVPIEQLQLSEEAKPLLGIKTEAEIKAASAAPPAAAPKPAAPAPPAPAAAPPAAPAAPAPTIATPPKLDGVRSLQRQNRLRGNAASVAQMMGIAEKPDYDRLSASKSPESGAPMVSVAGDTDVIPDEQIGRESIVTIGEEKVPIRYAVIEAGKLIASHTAEGKERQEYFADPEAGQIRALNNGRAAGLREAYARDTAAAYRKLMMEDPDHGIDSAVIRAMDRPVLVRVYPDSFNTTIENIGEKSQGQTLKQSPLEIALQDAAKLTEDDLALFDVGDSGNVQATSNEAFIKRFLAKVVSAEDRGAMIDQANNKPNKALYDRIEAAIFQKAYGSKDLTGMFAEASDPEIRAVLNALAIAAPEMAKLEGAPEQLDIRPWVSAAAGLMLNAKRAGVRFAVYVQQADFARDPLVQQFAQIMADNIRSPRAIGDALKAGAQFAQWAVAQTATADIFGDPPRYNVSNALAAINKFMEEANAQREAARSEAQEIRAQPPAVAQESPEYPSGRRTAGRADAQRGAAGTAARGAAVDKAENGAVRQGAGADQITGDKSATEDSLQGVTAETAIPSVRSAVKLLLAGKLNPIPERNGECYRWAGKAAIAGKGDFVIGVLEQGVAGPNSHRMIWHAVVMDAENRVYDAVLDRWFAPGVLEKLNGWTQVRRMTAVEVARFAGTQFIIGTKDESGNWVSIGEGPFDSKVEAERFAGAEVGVEYRIAKIKATWPSPPLLGLKGGEITYPKHGQFTPLKAEQTGAEYNVTAAKDVKWEHKATLGFYLADLNGRRATIWPPHEKSAGGKGTRTWFQVIVSGVVKELPGMGRASTLEEAKQLAFDNRDIQPSEPDVIEPRNPARTPGQGRFGAYHKTGRAVAGVEAESDEEADFLEQERARYEVAQTKGKYAGLKWGKPNEDGEHTITYNNRQYSVYFDRQSAAWRATSLINAGGGTPVDFIGFNRQDVEDRVVSGALAKQIDRYVLEAQTPADLKAKAEALEKSEKEKARREAEAAKGKPVKSEQVDMFNTQGGLFDSIDAAAAATKKRTPPTEAQQEAGNYQKPRFKLDNGLVIAVETAAGQTRRPEWPPLQDSYGYFEGTTSTETTSAKKEALDVFVKDGTKADFDGSVFVVNQTAADGSFDEHKVMLGYANPRKAREAYQRNYPEGWEGGKTIVRMNMAGFKLWATDHTANGPKGGKLTIQKARNYEAQAAGELPAAEGSDPHQGDESPQRDLFAPIPIPGTNAVLPEKVVVELEEVRRFRLPDGKITNGAEAAQAFAQLLKSPRERFQVIALDKNNKPIAAYDLFAGTTTQTSVYPREVATVVHMTPGVRSVWFAHHHPSGVAEPSQADQLLTRNIRDAAFLATGVQISGHVILAGDNFVVLDEGGEPMERAKIPPVERGYTTVPVYERVITFEDQSQRDALTAPAAARDYFRLLDPKEPGVLILDAQHRVLGWWPVKMEQLMGGPRSQFFSDAADLIRKVGRNNPAAAMLWAPHTIDQRTLEVAARALRDQLSALDVKVLDAFLGTRAVGGESLVGMMSFAERGLLDSATEGRPYFSLIERFQDWVRKPGDLSKLVDLIGIKNPRTIEVAKLLDAKRAEWQALNSQQWRPDPNGGTIRSDNYDDIAPKKKAVAGEINKLMDEFEPLIRYHRPNYTGIRYSLAGRESLSDVAMTEKELEGDPLRAKLGDRVKVVQSVHELPEWIVRQAARINVLGRIEGVFDPLTGDIYLVASKIPPGAAARVLLHESVGHFGMNQVLPVELGKELTQAQLEIYNARTGAITAEVNAGFLKPYRYNLKNEGDRAHAASEWLARQAEEGKEQGLWARFVAKVRSLFRKAYRLVGMEMELTDNDILRLMQKARQAIVQGRGLSAEAMQGMPMFSLRGPGVIAWDDAPVNEADYIKQGEYNKALNPYFKDGVLIANSRTTPNEEAFPPVGAWRINDSPGPYGREVEKLVAIPVDKLMLTELDSQGRLDPVKAGDDIRYARWLEEGRRAPPIEVVQTDGGKLNVTDGHRRALAAKRAGHTTIEAWVNFAVPIPAGWRYNGDPTKKFIRTGLTFEMLTGEQENQFVNERMPYFSLIPTGSQGPSEMYGFSASDGRLRGIARRPTGAGPWEVRTTKGDPTDLLKRGAYKFTRASTVAEVQRAFQAAGMDLRSARPPNLPPADGAVLEQAGRAFNLDDTDIKALTGRALHPRTIASFDPDFAPVVQAAEAQFEERDFLVSEMHNELKAYTELSGAMKRRVNAVAELGRLNKTTYGRGPAAVIVENTANPDAALSKVGDRFELTDREKSGYWALRRSMDLALSFLKSQIIRDLGLDPTVVTTPDQVLNAIPAGAPAWRKNELKQLAENVKHLIEMRRTGYIPFTRWGQYGIVVKDAAGAVIHYEQIEGDIDVRHPTDLTARQIAERRTQELREKYPTAMVLGPMHLSKAQGFAPVDLGMLDQLARLAHVDKTEYGVMRAQLAEAEKKLGFRAHLTPARDIPGYSQDFERSTADYIVGIASYLARRRYRAQWEDAIGKIPAWKTRLRQYANTYHEYADQPHEEFQGLRSAAYLYYIAGVPTTAAINLTQPLLTTWPLLQSFTNTPDATWQLSRALGETMLMIKPHLQGLLKPDEFFTPNQAPADVRDALTLAWERGFMAPLTTMEMMGMARNRASTLRKLDKRTRQTIEFIAHAFMTAERANRIVSFIAAYRIAGKPGMKAKILSTLEDNALAQLTLRDAQDFPGAFAQWVVDETQFRTGKVNRATLQRGVGTVIFQFRDYAWQMIELQMRTAMLAGGRGKVSVALMLMLLGLIAGLWGLPFAENLRAAIEFALRKMTDKDHDLKVELRETMRDLTGSARIAEMIANGAARGFDDSSELSGRIGLGQILPDVSSPTAALGVGADLLWSRWQKSHAWSQRGEPELAAAQALPNFLKNWIEADRMAEGGVRSQLSGAKLVHENEVTAFDIWSKRLGGRSRKIAEATESEYAQNRASHAIDELRRAYYYRVGIAMAREAMARRNGDAKAEQQAMEKKQDALEALRKYNEGRDVSEQIILDPNALGELVAKELVGPALRDIRAPIQSRSRRKEIEQLYGQ